MAQRKKGRGKAGSLLKTMGRGSPRTRAPEEAVPSEETGVAASPDDPPEEEAVVEAAAATETPATSGRASGSVSGRSSGRTAAATRPKRRERPAKPVRITVDLDADRHRFLRDFAYREDARGTEVVRALLDELAADAELVGRVQDRLAGE